MHPLRLIPRPAQLEPLPGEAFTLGADTRIAARGNGAEAVAQWLGALLRRGTGLPLAPADGDGHRGDGADPAVAGGDDVVALRVDPASALGAEGYRLTVSPVGVRLEAAAAAGLFRGAQTLRQLLPPAIERGGAAGPWTVPAVRIEDRPRFAWRGVMLDVARHFLGADAVRRWLDLAVLYKVNVLHLHLTDDQGWRIAIDGWPRLTEHGGSTQVGGGAGGWFTQSEYAELVRHAAERHVTIVPEVDLPGHTNAALASYPELGGGGPARDLYTGTSVGFSTLAANAPSTGRFLDDVFGQLAALTPGPWLHIGGDEAAPTAHADYVALVTRAQDIVRAHGKRPVGWQEIAGAPLEPGTVVQYWNTRDARAHDLARRAARTGARLLMSPADRVYLDMKYDADTPLGVAWAGPVDARDAYAWDPAALVAGVGEEEVIGVEAALWTETIQDVRDAEYMTFPRLPGIAEVGWSAAADWEEYRHRLAAQAPRWEALGMRFHRSAGVPWPAR